MDNNTTIAMVMFTTAIVVLGVAFVWTLFR